MAKPETPTNPHANFLPMHSEMAAKFDEWLDEITRLQVGWKLSDLRKIEATIALLVTSGDLLAPEEQVVLDRMISQYKKVWRRKRLFIG